MDLLDYMLCFPGQLHSNKQKKNKSHQLNTGGLNKSCIATYENVGPPTC